MIPRFPAGGVQFAGDGGAEFVPAVLELGQAFAFEAVGDLRVVDAEPPGRAVPAAVRPW